jgi:hypothetical protein
MPLGRFVRKRIFQPTTGLCPRLGFLELEEIRIKLRSLFKRLEKRVAQRYERLQGLSLCHLAFISFHIASEICLPKYELRISVARTLQ